MGNFVASQALKIRSGFLVVPDFWCPVWKASLGVPCWSGSHHGPEYALEDGGVDVESALSSDHEYIVDPVALGDLADQPHALPAPAQPAALLPPPAGAAAADGDGPAAGW